MKAIKLHLAVVGAGVMFTQGVGATTVSISGQQFTDTPPVEEVPFPAMSSGSFTHFDTTSIPGQVTSALGASSSATYNIAPSVNFAFTILWNAPNASEQVQFFSGVDGTGQLEGSFTGADLMCGGCGFSLVTFAAIGGSIGSVVLSDSASTSFVYEIAEEPLTPSPSPPPPVLPPPVAPPPVIPPPIIPPLPLPEIPLPGALPLFLGGLAVLGFFGRRRHK